MGHALLSNASLRKGWLTGSVPLLENSRTLLPDLVDLRRRLHRSPELGLHLPKTQALVLEALAGLDLEITLGTRTTSVAAVLRGGTPGPTVLLRGDMDALPIVEKTGLDFAAENGNMHACGHDLHVAGLVGAVRLLHERRADLVGDVLFMFQPGEEGQAGARVMIEEGMLEVSGSMPIAAYGIHVTTGERGLFATRPGTIMAGANHVTITVHGEGGHGSLPSRALDPVPAIAEIVTALNAMVTRRFSVFDPVVVSVTKLSAGAAFNVIADSASLGATVRNLSLESLTVLREEIPRLATGIAEAHGCHAEVDFEVVYPVTVNDADRTAETVHVLRELFGDDRVEHMDFPLMGSEDFSFVLERVPGTFVFLHASPDGVDAETAPGNHSPRVLFDDAVLADSSAALAQLALTALATAAAATTTPTTAAPTTAATTTPTTAAPTTAATTTGATATASATTGAAATASATTGPANDDDTGTTP
jgi:amidohydrolase